MIRPAASSVGFTRALRAVSPATSRRSFRIGCARLIGPSVTLPLRVDLLKGGAKIAQVTAGGFLPSATFAQPASVECSSFGAGQVTLSSVGTSDADGDTLAYEWASAVVASSDGHLHDGDHHWLASSLNAPHAPAAHRCDLGLREPARGQALHHLDGH